MPHIAGRMLRISTLQKAFIYSAKHHSCLSILCSCTNKHQLPLSECCDNPLWLWCSVACLTTVQGCISGNQTCTCLLPHTKPQEGSELSAMKGLPAAPAQCAAEPVGDSVLVIRHGAVMKQREFVSFSSATKAAEHALVLAVHNPSCSHNLLISASEPCNYWIKTVCWPFVG